MFLLEDGRKLLYQWDLNRRLQVEDPTITEVHFCNRTDDCALVVATYTDDTYDGKTYADIPNIILQQPWDIRAYAYCTDGYTKIEEVFEVKARTKPSDYVYTETEVKLYEYLDAKLTEIEEKGFSEETVSEAVTSYFEEHPVQTITKVSELENDAGYATEEYVDKAIEAIPEPEKVDLTGYATEDYVIDAIANAQLEGEEVDLSTYAKKTDIPTKVSQLSNDKGYLTEHQSLEGYAKLTDIPSHEGLATEQYVDDAIAAIEFPESDCAIGIVTNTSTAADIEAIRGRGDWPVFVNETNGMHLPLVDITAGRRAYHFGAVYKNMYYIAELTTASNTWTENVDSIADLTGYATETYVNDAIAQASLGEEVDLSEYAKKTDIPDVSDFISEIPAEYVTETELNAKGYLTEHQSLDEYAKKSELFSKDYNDLTNKPTIPSTEGLATETYVDEAVGALEIPKNYATTAYVDSVFSDLSLEPGGSPLYHHDVELVMVRAIGGQANVYLNLISDDSVALTPETLWMRLSRDSNKLVRIMCTGSAAFSRETGMEYVDFDYLLASGTSTGTMAFSLQIANSITPVFSAIIGTDNVIVYDSVIPVGVATVTGGEAADLSNYYTKDETYSKTEVDALIDNIELPEAAQGCDLEFIDNTATGEDILVILNAGKWPVYRYADTYSVYHLPLVDESAYYYNFGGVITDRRYTIRYSKESNTWESSKPSIDYFLDESEVVANPTAEATEALTKLTLKGTTYSIPENAVIVDTNTSRSELQAFLNEGKIPVFKTTSITDIGELYLPLLSVASSNFLFCSSYPGSYQGFYYISCTDSGWDSSVGFMPFNGGGEGSGEAVDLSNYVTLDGTETLTGKKTFNAGFTVNNGTTGGITVESSGTGNNEELKIKHNALQRTMASFSNTETMFYSGGSNVCTIGSKGIYSWYNKDLGTSIAPWATVYATNLSDGTTTKTMAEVLAGGGSSSGDSEVKEVFCLDMAQAVNTASGKSFTQEIKDFVAYWKANGNKCPVFVRGVTGYNGWVPVEISYSTTTDTFYLKPLVNTQGLSNVLQGSDYTYNSYTFNCADETYYKSNATIAGIERSGGGGWSYTQSLSDGNLYNAKEVYILVQTNGKYVFSHFYDCDNLLGYCSNEHFYFTTPDGMDNSTPSWYFDGAQICLEGFNDWTIRCIGYKL